MHKTLRDIVKTIQFKKQLTIAEIAKSIGYSRTYFTLEIDKDKNEKIREMLLDKYGDLFDKRTVMAGMASAKSVDHRQHALPFAPTQGPDGLHRELLLKDKIIELLEFKLKSNLDELQGGQDMLQAVVLSLRQVVAELVAKHDNQDILEVTDRLNKLTAAYLADTKKTDN